MLLVLMASFSTLAAPFDSLIFDQEGKRNIKKLNELNRNKGTTLLWWNVAFGKYNSDHSIDKNLLTLNADIVALGEFKPDVLQESALATLNQIYKYSVFVPYTLTSAVGIMFFSKHPFRASETFALDWAPLKAATREAETYRQDWKKFDPNWSQYWDRTFAYYKVSLPTGHEVNIAPVHLSSPWQSVHKRHGNWKTLRILMGAQENPLLHQQQHMQEVLRREFGPDMNNEPLVLTGDFNVPAKVPIPLLGGTPKQYKQLLGSLTKVLDSGDDTFPAKSAAFDQTGMFAKHEVQIDHVFHNKKIKSVKAEVLNLKGSDHYPLLMVLEP